MTNQSEAPPATFDEFVQHAFDNQCQEHKPFATVQDAREWLIKSYPGIDKPEVYAVWLDIHKGHADKPEENMELNIFFKLAQTFWARGEDGEEVTREMAVAIKHMIFEGIQKDDPQSVIAEFTRLAFNGE